MPSSRKIKLEVITPEKILFKGEVDMVELPGEQGRFQVLPDHAALVSLLTKGDLQITKNKEVSSFPIQKGFVEIKENTVVVLAGNI